MFLINHSYLPKYELILTCTLSQSPGSPFPKWLIKVQLTPAHRASPHHIYTHVVTITGEPPLHSGNGKSYSRGNQAICISTPWKREHQ